MEVIQMPPIKKLTQFTPVAITKPAEGVYIFDLKQNMAGTCEIRIDDTSAVNRGDVMRVEHAEAVDAEGHLIANWVLGELTAPGVT
jgi:hypothetical protein